MCVAMLASVAVSCYDDSELRASISDLESQVKSINDKLNSGVVITAVKQTTTGYELTMSNGTVLVLSNGQNGAPGEQGPAGANGSNVSVVDVKIAEPAVFAMGETKTFNLNVSGVDIKGICGPQGWSQKVSSAGEVAVKAPVNPYDAINSGKVFVVATNETSIVMASVEVSTNVTILTFEDEDFKGTMEAVNTLVGWAPALSSAQNYWSSLIDETEYDGNLLYGPMDEYYCYSATYKWVDAGNTNLAMNGFAEYWGSYAFSSGGEAISNYYLANLDKANYLHQLSVPIIDEYTGYSGYNGSKNFCVHFGHEADKGSICFADGKARIIKSMQITLTSFFCNGVFIGDGFFGPLKGDSFLAVKAVGYDASGNEVGTLDRTLATANEAAAYSAGTYEFRWQEWDLSPLGEVVKVNFIVYGSEDCYGAYGFNAPGYFAYDDVIVVTPLTR